MATMSPASASSSGVPLDAAEGEDLGDAAGFDQLAVARRCTFTAWFGLIEPEVMRPVMMRPR